MLTSLSIKNFALIEKLSIEFENGFTTITGETGAGKSILLGALGLVLGKRADLTSLKNKEEKCVIEAQFSISKYNLQSFFESHDFDYDAFTIIRREILPSGKSRAFVNDSPVNVSDLQELGVYLIDIHSQQQTQELSDEKIQFEIIDAIAENGDLLDEYSLLLKTYKSNKSELQKQREAYSNAQKEQDYNTFLLNELVEAKLVSGSQEDLEEQFQQLNNVEFIKENLEKSLSLAEGEQFGVSQSLKEIRTSLQKISNLTTEYNAISERANSVLIEFEDIVSEINTLAEQLVNDPEQLELLNQKLQLIYSLQKKHQVNTVEQLISIQSGLESKAFAVQDLEDAIAKLETALENNEKDLDKVALHLHQRRQKAIPVLAEKLVGYLVQLGMPNSQFDIQLSPKENYFTNGKDELQFLFSANKGVGFGLLKKVASGGEMSRIMLAVKAVLAQYSKLPTIIFDEIDTGVSGEIANKMAFIMEEMSANMQVFSITHLPQIAARGKQHYKVFKETIDNQTQSQIIRLTHEQRVQELAEMIAGKDLSEAAINHAKTLLN
ncbi:DNA repair protein RecN [Flavobacterium antarcticum]|uniref:DNA repair protein RecN n=1 Tax=Flavobacterium antarcticum TaxID=271155 RepID=UPI0003B4B197|nr:DNA repair protein RecN [Flavobacterium antarcticum]